MARAPIARAARYDSRRSLSPNALGLHWPLLDADLYVPGLIEGAFGSGRTRQSFSQSRRKSEFAAALERNRSRRSRVFSIKILL